MNTVNFHNNLIIGGILTFFVIAPVCADTRGADILQQQLVRAQHLKELEYQAEVLERQARIAKAQEQIDKTVGLASVEMNKPKAESLPKKVDHSLPLVVELAKNSATLQFENGSRGVYQIGDDLPSGHTIISISMIDGVEITDGQGSQTINYRW